MSPLTSYTIRRVLKLTITSPVWIFLLVLGGISEIIRITGELIEGIGKAIKSGGRSLDSLFMRFFADPGTPCDKLANWVNK